MTLAAGTRLGAYEVVSPLGAGGMGEVYLARDTRLAREVAVKVLPAAIGNDPDRVARFHREAQVLATLNHPHIAQVYGFEDSGPIRALVMELVPGPTLADRIALGPLPIDEALSIARQVAEALEAAHGQGVIHRDLKPANVKVRDDGAVKVLDFGLAKLADPAASGASRTVEVTASPTLISPALMTGAGVILGTAAYMAPEQARGKTVDRRADIWAFGCLLYEMLTASRPFAADEVSDTLAMVLMKEPDWSRLPSATPQAIRKLLQRCMQKDPARRLPDIGSARLEIDETLAGPQDPGPRPAGVSQRRRERVAWTAAAGAAIAAIGVAAVHLTEVQPAPAPVMRFSVIAPANSTIFDGVNSLMAHTVSPDGRHVAFQTVREGRATLSVRSLDQEAAHELPGTDNLVGAFWSPDSRTIALVADGKLKRIDLTGGPPQVICDVAAFAGGTWNRDGTILFASGTAGTPVMRVNATGGTPAPATTLAEGEASHRFPWFLPDGNHFLYVASTAPTGSPANGYAMYVGSLDGAPPVRVGDTDAKAIYASGHLLFIRGATLTAQPFDLDRMALTGDPQIVAGDVRTNLITGAAAFSASDNGVLAYRTLQALAPTQLTWVDRTGRVTGTVGDPDDQTALSLSPDGTRAIVAVFDRSRNTRDLWIHELNRPGLRTRFTFDPGEDWESAWSPDGRRIAFSAARGGALDLYVQSADGSGAAELLFERPGNEYVSSWSSDGKELLFHTGNAGSPTGNDIWVLPMDGKKTPVPLLQSKANETGGRFSPDGRWIVYQSNESGVGQVFVAPRSGTGRWQISTSGGSGARWGHNGQELFFFSPDDELMAAEVDGDGPAFRVGAVRPLFRARRRTENYLGLGVGNVFDVTPDGRRFLIDMTTGNAPPPTPVLVITNWSATLR